MAFTTSQIKTNMLHTNNFLNSLNFLFSSVKINELIVKKYIQPFNVIMSKISHPVIFGFGKLMNIQKQLFRNVSRIDIPRYLRYYDIKFLGWSC